MDEPEKEYTVVWMIDVVADSPRRAAERAREIQRMPDNWSGVFQVLEGQFGTGMLPDNYYEFDLDDNEAVVVDVDRDERKE